MSLAARPCLGVRRGALVTSCRCGYLGSLGRQVAGHLMSPGRDPQRVGQELPHLPHWHIMRPPPD